jgi:hypothetical protein
MDNQHKQIKGYRDLSQVEIDLMNRIKIKEAEVLALHNEVHALLVTQPGQAGDYRYREILDAEPLRWAAIAKTDIQTGFMALIRAVAQPASLVLEAK